MRERKMIYFLELAMMNFSISGFCSGVNPNHCSRGDTSLELPKSAHKQRQVIKVDITLLQDKQKEFVCFFIYVEAKC